MISIFTHVRPDLDAVSSVWYFKRFVAPKEAELQLVFVPANWKGEEMQEGDVALDIEAGGKGDKGTKLPDGRVMSCFAGLVKRYGGTIQQDVLRPVVEFVDAQDSTGDAFLAILGHLKRHGAAGEGADFVGIDRQDIPASIRIGGLGSMLRVMERLAKGNDAETVRRFSEILDAIYDSGIEMLSAEVEADKAERVGRPGDINALEPVALVVSGSKNPHLHAKVFGKPGVRVIVRLDGANLCVLRKDTEKVNLGEIVRPFIEKTAPADEAKEWFYHSAGFLAARGTLKAPAKTPSRVDARELARHIANSL